MASRDHAVDGVWFLCTQGPASPREFPHDPRAARLAPGDELPPPDFTIAAAAALPRNDRGAAPPQGYNGYEARRHSGHSDEQPPHFRCEELHLTPLRHGVAYGFDSRLPLHFRQDLTTFVTNRRWPRLYFSGRSSGRIMIREKGARRPMSSGEGRPSPRQPVLGPRAGYLRCHHSTLDRGVLQSLGTSDRRPRRVQPARWVRPHRSSMNPSDCPARLSRLLPEQAWPRRFPQGTSMRSFLTFPFGGCILCRVGQAASGSRPPPPAPIEHTTALA